MSCLLTLGTVKLGVVPVDFLSNLHCWWLTGSFLLLDDVDRRTPSLGVT